MAFPLKPQNLRRSAQLAALGVGLLAMTLITGCAGQDARIKTTVGDPAVDVALTNQDFDFPSQPPSLKHGREIFQAQCAQCHVAGFWQTQKVKEDLAYTTPIDLYQFLTTGEAQPAEMPTRERHQLLKPWAKHPVAYKDKMLRDDRWAVIFYTRYLAGAGDIASPDPKTDVPSIFGGNCAVCHGTKGRADGPLYTGKTGNHELHNGDLQHVFVPPPADFRMYSRMYNRTDAQLFKYICQGVYPSAMPSWYGNVNVDKDTGKPTYVFNDSLIWNLVRHVRSLAYTNDLDPDTMPEAKTPPKGLQQLQACPPSPNNRPWTGAMKQNAPNKEAGAYQFPAGDPRLGGMTFESVSGKMPAYPAQENQDKSHSGGDMQP